jgi:hypothetical protein
MAITRQRSGDGSLRGDDRAISFRGTVDAGGKAVPPKLPESLDFDFWQAPIFLPEDRFGGSEDVNEVVEGSCRHIEFQILYIRGQKLELSRPICQGEYKAERGAIYGITECHRLSLTLSILEMSTSTRLIEISSGKLK